MIAKILDIMRIGFAIIVALIMMVVLVFLVKKDLK
jgi:hypothetical protein